MDETAEGPERERLANGDTPVETLDAFIDAHLPRVTARLWATCCWPESMAEGWKVGDFRYVIFSVEPDGASLYVQFWSEPGETVLAEVCSGNWNPGAVEYLGRAERDKLQRLGYEVGGRAGNFCKEVTIAAPGDAERYAREALTIVFDVFGYRGRWPFHVERERGERAETGPTYQAVTPEDFAKLAAEVGYRVAVTSAEEIPVAVLTMKRRRSVAFCVNRVAKENLFSGMILRAIVNERERTDATRVSEVNRELFGPYVVRDADGDLMIEEVIHLRGGVTAQWIMNQLAHWDEQVRAAERLVRRSPRRTAPTRKQHVTTH